MNGTAARFFRLALSLAGLVTLGWVLTGQAAKPAPQRMSLPTDWSHSHLIFSHPKTAQLAARLNQDPRYQQQILRREQRLALSSARPSVAANLEVPGVHHDFRSVFRKIKRKPFRRDWAKTLGLGGSAGAANYPAKFSFNIGSALCDAAVTPDYTVFSTGLAGSLTQASVIAYDNLYFGCGGGTPLNYWAYNTGGQILTSPVLSLDGTQVAFMQTSGGAASLVILKWSRNIGTFNLPITLVPVPTTLYSACIAPCMTEVPIVDGASGPLDDTTSSAYYDYTNDVAWTGGASGWLHKITGVFNGQPTEVTTGGFPVQVNTGSPSNLSSPVYDRITGNVFVSDVGGYLYHVNSTTAVVTRSVQLDLSASAIMSGPLLDSAAGRVYFFSADDGSANCSDGIQTVDCTGVFQFHVDFAANDFGVEAEVGISNALGTPNPELLGSFDTAYYTSIDATGNLYVCGNGGANATLYQVPILDGKLPVAGLGSVIAPLASTGSTAACSGVTDFLNENTTAGPVERLFVSVQNNGLATSCGGAGCVFSIVDTPWIADNNYILGQQIMSTKGHIETVIKAGTSAFGAPAWTTQVGQTVSDGTVPDNVVWIDQGQLQVAPYTPWLPSHVYAPIQHLLKVLDTNNNVEELSTVGTSGAVQPTWSLAVSGTTADGTAVWTNVGPLAMAALPVSGGTSGMIIDNMVGSATTAGASQIYFTTLTDQPGCGFEGAGGCAVQAAQTNLN